MQGVERIDVSNIWVNNATDQHPITLHYGRHLPFQTETIKPPATEVQLTSASIISNPAHLPVKVTGRHQPTSAQPSTKPKPVCRRDQSSLPKSSILSVMQIKAVCKRQNSLNNKLISKNQHQQTKGCRQQAIIQAKKTIAPPSLTVVSKISLVKNLEGRTIELGTSFK